MNRGRPNVGVMLLVFEMLNVGLDRIPKVTLATIVGQMLIYLRILPVPGIRHVCASVIEVHYREDYRRLVLATYFHADDWHLYFNMVSFLWKGLSLEPIFGSVYMAALIGIFGVLTNVVMLLLNGAAEIVLHQPSYLSDCGVGFSGVLFALKVITTQRSPPQERRFIFGLIPIPMKYIVWAELVVIQLISPNVSFTGHLAGILVGLAFTCGPLKSLMDSIFLPTPRVSHGRTWGGGRIGSRRSGDRPTDRSGNNMDDYTAGLTEEEQMRAAMDASLHEATTRSAPGEINSDEMRRRRLARFQT